MNGLHLPRRMQSCCVRRGLATPLSRPYDLCPSICQIQGSPSMQLRGQKLTSSQNCRVNVWNRFVVIEKRSVFTTQMLVGFLDRLWSCQKIMVYHVPDLDRYCPEERAFALRFWSGAFFYWIYLHTTPLDTSERPKHA